MTLKEQIKVTKQWIESSFYDLDTKYYFEAVQKSLKKLQRLEQHDDGKIENYQQYVDLYFEFHQQTVGVKPRMTAAAGKALKQIISYLADNVKGERYTALDAWKFILNNWDKLTKFIQNQVTLTQINRNLPEILMQLRNGATTQQKQQAASAAIKARIRNRRHGGADQVDH